jgi:hypothetical protein
MNIKKILFLFVFTFFSSIALVGCGESEKDFKEKNQDKMIDHGHSH